MVSYRHAIQPMTDADRRAALRGRAVVRLYPGERHFADPKSTTKPRHCLRLLVDHIFPTHGAVGEPPESGIEVKLLELPRVITASTATTIMPKMLSPYLKDRGSCTTRSVASCTESPAASPSWDTGSTTTSRHSLTSPRRCTQRRSQNNRAEASKRSLGEGPTLRTNLMSFLDASLRFEGGQSARAEADSRRGATVRRPGAWWLGDAPSSLGAELDPRHPWCGDHRQSHQ